MNNFIGCLLSVLFCSTGLAQESFEVSFEHDGKVVYGTFSTPAGEGPYTTIVINPGSGPNDRDGTLLMFGGNTNCLYPGLVLQTLRPYRDLADALVDSGYAVLRYDKLEHTYPNTLGTITFHKLWLPVESAIEFLKTRDDVDPNRIILIGHSEGSTLIPFIAKDRSDIRALVSIAGARTPFDSILAYQLVHIARTCNGDTVAAKNQATQILSYFNTIRTNMWNASTPSLFGVPASAWYDYVVATDPVAAHYNMNDLPTLFIGLGLDINVPPSELARFQEEVTITDDFWSLAELIHFMTPKDDPHVSEQLTDTIIYWLKQQGLSTSIRPEIKFKNSVTVFPNPFRDVIEIKSDDDRRVQSYCVRDVLGSALLDSGRLRSQGNRSTHIDLRFLPEGVYFLEVQIGSTIVVLKLLKL